MCHMSFVIGHVSHVISIFFVSSCIFGHNGNFIKGIAVQGGRSRREDGAAGLMSFSWLEI